MFYKLYGTDDILDGGLWFNPDTVEYVEVINMDSAAGEEGLWMAMLGAGYFNEDRVWKALENADFVRKSRKGWDPRSSSTTPGVLTKEGANIYEAFKAWEALASEGRPFEDLPQSQRKDALAASEFIFGYYSFDGAPDQSVGVSKLGSESAENADQQGWVVTKNPARYLKALLNRWMN